MAGSATRQMPIVEALSGGQCLTTTELKHCTQMTGSVVSDTCCKLVARGWIVRRERGCFELSKHGKQAVKNGETITSGPTRPLTQGYPKKRRKLTARCAIWRSIRILRKFTIGELEILTSASHDNTMQFVGYLLKSGVLIPLKREPGAALTSNGFRRWFLMHDLGPETPIWRPTTRELFDPNSNSVFEVTS